MKYFLVFAHLIFICGLALAEEITGADYELGKQALAKNDCPTAIRYLEKYKSENLEKLKLHKKFLEQLDKQISICKKNISDDNAVKSIIANSTENGANSAIKNTSATVNKVNKINKVITFW